MTLSAITVSDSKIGDVSCPTGTLDPGISTTCTDTYTATAFDLGDAQLVNSATVTGTSPSGALDPVASNEVVIQVSPSTTTPGTLPPSGGQLPAVGRNSTTPAWIALALALAGVTLVALFRPRGRTGR